MKVIPRPELLPGLRWEMQPFSCSALGHLGPGAGLATLPSVHTAAEGWGQQLALQHCAMGCEAQGKIQEMREGAQDELHRFHLGRGLAAAATSNISYGICVYPWALLRQSGPVLFSCILRQLLATPNCCHRPPSALATTPTQCPGSSSSSADGVMCKPELETANGTRKREKL